MQINYHDESMELVRNATVEEAFAKLGDPNVKSVMLHKPGSVIEMRDGTKYKVTDNGSWKKLGDGE